MIEFFSRLLDTSDFPARWSCGRWDSFHGWLHIISDVAIWAAYGAIPLALIYFCGKKRKEILHTRIVMLFAAFIVACGTVHLIEAIIFYYPVYRLSGLVKFFTAVISWITVIAVWKNLPAAIELPGLARLNDSLKEALEERRAAEQEAALAHEELQTLTALVAHDLRNPLSSALMMSQVVQEQAKSAGASAISSQMEAVVLSLNKIRESLARLDQPVDEASNGSAPCEVDLNEVLDEIRIFLASSIVANDARIEADPLPKVKGDQLKFFHLLTNIVENSIKYRGEEPPLIQISATNDKLWHRLSVCDNGRGIDDDELEQMFRSEFRGRNGSSEPGTGMGLAHCRRIVSALGGNIEAKHSELGGVCVVIELPLTSAEVGG